MKRFLALLVIGTVFATAVPASAHQPHPRSAAVGVGNYHGVGDHWKVKVVQDRWKVSQDRWGERPSRGYDFLVVKVRAKRLSGGEGDAYMDLNFDLFGGVTKRLYSSLGDCIPRGWIGDKDPVYPGGIVTGTVCFEVRESDRRFKLRVEDSWDWDGRAIAWYKTR